MLHRATFRFLAEANERSVQWFHPNLRDRTNHPPTPKVRLVCGRDLIQRHAIEIIRYRPVPLSARTMELHQVAGCIEGRLLLP